MKTRLSLALSVLCLSGCATTPSTNIQSEPTPKPTYTEKAGALSVNEFNGGSCPANPKWESSDWRKAVIMANACVKARDWRKVEILGNDLAVQAHLTPWGAYFLSLAAENRRDLPRALWMMELALKKAPQEGLFHYQLGRLYWQSGEDQLALKELKLASDDNASLTEAHFVMGQLSLAKESFGEAEKYFRKALTNHPKHWGSLMGMATVKMQGKDWTEAVAYLEQGIRLNSRSTKARLALANVHETQLKNLPEALSAYKDLRSLSTAKKLDEAVAFNLDEKISALEKSLAQNSKGKELVRKPTAAEGQVTK